MVSRLFHAVVASSGLLLTGCGAAVVPAAPGDVPVAPPDVPDVPVALPDLPAVARPDVPVLSDVPAALPDVPVFVDASVETDVTALVDAALADARSQEIGWPTTKGAFCWATDAGPVACCRGLEGNLRTQCCTPVPGGCAPCADDGDGGCAPIDPDAGAAP